MLWESRCVLTGVRGQRPGHSLCWFTREGGSLGAALCSEERAMGLPGASLHPALGGLWASSSGAL